VGGQGSHRIATPLNTLQEGEEDGGEGWWEDDVSEKEEEEEEDLRLVPLPTIAGSSLHGQTPAEDMERDQMHTHYSHGQDTKLDSISHAIHVGEASHYSEKDLPRPPLPPRAHNQGNSGLQLLSKELDSGD